jgi:hypothetical protein
VDRDPADRRRIDPNNADSRPICHFLTSCASSS